LDELTFFTANELASIIRQHKASSQEVLQAHLSHIATLNPSLNAIITLDEEQACRRSKEADEALARGEIWGPLHGVPVTIKDVFETAGMRTTSSFRPLATYVPKQDATVVARLRQAGAIIMGKTNRPELAGDEQTNSPLFGRTNNPWNTGRTPGGSSGGSAAAVASGMSPLDIGSDIGGSIRNPAHFCGIFSLKPSDCRVPFTGHIPPPPGSKGRGLLRYFLTPGPLARSVEDLLLALTIIAGPDERQWEVPPVPLAPSHARDLRELRFAWSDDFGVPVSAEIRTALATGVYTGLFNLTGNPVVVLPLAHTKEGLPIGVQVVGRRWNGMALLAVAEQLTQVTGKFQAPPGLQVLKNQVS
jgi:amidase